jgi:hypothetical protein
VSVQPIGPVPDSPPRALRNWARLLITLLTLTLAAVGAFNAWGPIGVGPGPIGDAVMGVSVTSGVHRTQPAMFMTPVDAGRSGAVIDRVEVLSDGLYPAPRVISIEGDRQQNCGGAWPLKGKQNFYRVCAAGGLVPLLGRALPARSRVSVRGLGRVTYSGIGAAIKAAPPGHAGCWMVTSVVIHYHVGIRHYTATHTMSLTACSRKVGPE